MAKPTRYTQEMYDEYIEQGYWTSDMTCEFWNRNAIKHPGKEAFVDPKNRLTWLQAKQQSDRLALGLLELGFNKDDVLVMQLPNCVESFLIRCACQKAGILCATPLTTLRQREMEYILKRLEAKGVVIPWKLRGFDYFDMIKQVHPSLPALKHIFVVGEEIPQEALSIKDMCQQVSEKKHTEDYLESTKFHFTEFAVIGLTSGTTGFPKFVEHPIVYRILLSRLTRYAVKLVSDDIILCAANSVAGLGGVLCYDGAAAEVGAKVVMLERWDAEEGLRWIEQERVSVLGAVPAQLASIVDHPDFRKRNLSSLRCIVSAAAALPSELRMNLEATTGARVVNIYGTFDGGAIANTNIDDPPEVRLRKVGRPQFGTEIRLVAEEGTKAEDMIGDIFIRGPSTCSGYYRDEEATKLAWGTLGKHGWFAVGDVVQMDELGSLDIIGRKKDLIIRGGQNIYPEEIETILSTHPKILRVAVVGMPDPIMGEKACAYVIPKPGEQFTFDEMVHYLEGFKLAMYKLPERLEIRESLPITGTDKIAKGLLREDIRNKLKADGKI